jgi:ribosome-interacting GTPase 1
MTKLFCHAKVGRSSLLSLLSNLKVEISSYPYTTKKPMLGLFHYQDLQFQIVEAPVLMEGFSRWRSLGTPNFGCGEKR